MRELLLGARLTLTGGRAGRVRAAITALGVALGVVALLVAASIPAIHDHRRDRDDARSDLVFRGPVPAGHGVLVGQADTDFRGRAIRGRLLEGDGAHPPGLARAPRAGELWVSPALDRLLHTTDGRRLLAARLPGRIAGEIREAGLVAPDELTFYAGVSGLHEGVGPVQRIPGFGSSSAAGGLDAVLGLLVVIGLAALLLPVGVLIAAAVRTGGEERDRRLAALRLVGADRGMARRIAAGEALTSAGAGLLLGTLAFALLRGQAGRLGLFDEGVFPGDVSPGAGLVALVVAGVPVVAVLVSLVALRRVVAEPLGVLRRAEAAGRRRLWWRLLLPAAGLLVLAPSIGAGAGGVSQTHVAIGVLALLTGIAALLPWVVERAVARLGAGAVAWQLAVRRLQLDAGGAARAVAGITVAVAGAIALQMVFAGVQGGYRTRTGADPARASLVVQLDRGTVATAQSAFARLAGVRSADVVARYPLDTQLTVGSCTTLRDVVRITGCRDGAVYAVGHVSRQVALPGGGSWRPGDLRHVGATADPSGAPAQGWYATPRAVRGRELGRASLTAFVRAASGDAQEAVRTAAAQIDPVANVYAVDVAQTDPRFATLRRQMSVGASIVVALVGLSLLLGALEQLRERRRLLAALVAFGTRRSTLGWSVLWQAAVPIGIGIGIAVATGLALGAILSRVLDVAVRVGWGDVLLMAGIGVLVVLAMTAASLPVLWRLMRPDGLRTE